MNFVPKMNRRSFLVGSRRRRRRARARHPVRAGQRERAGARTPELGVWVVIKPDDTVVIRIVRAEMGQGTITGLAQLVAEELECRLVEGHLRIPDAGRERQAQARLGLVLDRRQPRHPQVARICPPGRRCGAHDADAGGSQRVEGAGRRNHAPTRAC